MRTVPERRWCTDDLVNRFEAHICETLLAGPANWPRVASLRQRPPFTKNDDEGHERVTQNGHEQVPMSSADEGAALIERTFGNQIKPAANGSASLDKSEN